MPSLMEYDCTGTPFFFKASYKEFGIFKLSVCQIVKPTLQIYEIRRGRTP